MIELNAVTFWGLCIVAAMGMIRAAIDVFKSPEKANDPDWRKPALPEAPEGMQWVLVRKSDLNFMTGAPELVKKHDDKADRKREEI